MRRKWILVRLLLALCLLAGVLSAEMPSAMTHRTSIRAARFAPPADSDAAQADAQMVPGDLPPVLSVQTDLLVLDAVCPKTAIRIESPTLAAACSRPPPAR